MVEFLAILIMLILCKIFPNFLSCSRGDDEGCPLCGACEECGDCDGDNRPRRRRR